MLLAVVRRGEDRDGVMLRGDKPLSGTRLDTDRASVLLLCELCELSA